VNKNELCLLARLKKFFWTITRGKLSDPSALDCAVNRILIAVLGIKHEYLEYFEGRCMKPITERTKGPLKNLRAVLALWVNDEEMVDRHCKIIGSKEQKLVESKLNRDRGETSPTSLSPKKVNTFGASNQFHPFHYQKQSFSEMLIFQDTSSQNKIIPMHNSESTSPTHHISAFGNIRVVKPKPVKDHDDNTIGHILHQIGDGEDEENADEPSAINKSPSPEESIAVIGNFENMAKNSGRVKFALNENETRVYSTSHHHKNRSDQNNLGDEDIIPLDTSPAKIKQMKNRFLTSFAGLDPEAQDNVLIFFTKLITERAQHQSYMHLPTTARMASPTTRQHSSHTNLLFA
jgi:hypothetical protein